MAGFRQGSFDFESSKRAAGSGECKKNDSLLEHFDFLLSQATRATRDQAAADRLRAHLLAQLVCLGRHTLSALLTTNGQLHQDWSADYRLYSQLRLEPDELFTQIRRGAQQSLEPDQPLVVAMDDSIFRKTGRPIPGVGYRRDPLSPHFRVNLVLGMRFVQLSALVRQQDGFSRMIPIDFQQAPLPNRPPRNAPEEELQLYQAQLAAANINKVALSRVNFLRDQLDAEQDQEHPRDLRIVVDGRFTNAKLLKHLPHNTTLIGRIRRDAKLFYPPLAQAATGRKRVYSQEAPTPQELLKDPAVEFQQVQAQLGERSCQFRVKSLGPLRALQARASTSTPGDCPLGYRLRKGSKLLYRQPAFLICTDPTLAIQTLLQNYLWRWDIEVNFRDQKTSSASEKLKCAIPTVCKASQPPPLPPTAYSCSRRLSVISKRSINPNGVPTPSSSVCRPLP